MIGSTGLHALVPRRSSPASCPGWLINVATIIHSDEALLATGFIFTVHFFNTHLRPEKFPMDIGDLHRDACRSTEFKRDKPAEYEELVAAGKLEENLVEPYQPVVIRDDPGLRLDGARHRHPDRALDHLRDGVRVPLAVIPRDLGWTGPEGSAGTADPLSNCVTKLLGVTGHGPRRPAFHAGSDSR